MTKTFGMRSAVLGLSLALNAQAALAAGTAYQVDTSEVSDPGNCKVEAWTSHASNSDRLYTVNPACVVSTTEISAQITRSRSDDEWATTISPKAKMKLTNTSIGGVGLAVAGGVSYDATAKELSTIFAYMPATFRLSEVVRINVNGGWLNDRVNDRHFATYGLGLDWRFTETLTLTLETFGQLGNSDTPYETRPRYQAGVRWRPVDRCSIDFIYGRNLNGENANWFTIGTTVRFPPE